MEAFPDLQVSLDQLLVAGNAVFLYGPSLAVEQRTARTQSSLEGPVEPSVDAKFISSARISDFATNA